MSYALTGPAWVYAGRDALDHLGELLKDAKRICLVSDPGVAQTSAFGLVNGRLKGLEVVLRADAPTEPTLQQARELCAQCAGSRPDAVVAVGGGSVMDCAKLMAAAVTNPKMAEELPGAQGIRVRGVRTVMIPTTAGTGAEATGNAIVMLPEERIKQGVVSPLLMPDGVILDPEMVRDLPAALTAATGMDALAHALECLISRKANPFSDMFAMRALTCILPHIERSYRDGGDLQARENMQLGAFYGGMSIALSGTLAVHALAYPLSGRLHLSHGRAIALLLPPVMKAFEPACRAQFDRVARACALGEEGKRPSQALVERLYALRAMFHLEKTRLPVEEIPEMAREAAGIRRLMDNNPCPMSLEQIEAIFREIAL